MAERTTLAGRPQTGVLFTLAWETSVLFIFYMKNTIKLEIGKMKNIVLVIILNMSEQMSNGLPPPPPPPPPSSTATSTGEKGYQNDTLSAAIFLSS